MRDVRLTPEENGQVRWLRFEPGVEAEFQESASLERIRRIQIVVVTIVLLFLAAPQPKEVVVTPLMRQIGLATMVLTLLVLVLVFIPRFRKAAVLALPIWEILQQLAYGSVAPDPQPFMQSTIQLSFAIVIVAAVRCPAKISLAYAVTAVSLRILIWTVRGEPVGDYAGALSFLCFGMIFLVTGSYLTEIADRKSFLVGRLLDRERAKTHDLLTNVLPKEIADALQASSGAIASSHPSISVLFADVVNFTPFAADRPPAEVVGFLNDLFSRFDALVERSGLEKIKTVGDAYMVASGLPTFREDHLAALADLALEMRGAASAMGAEVRFGLHSGPAVAGVLGTKRLMYDIWGATVNLAARLESSATAGEIHVSQEVRDKLQGSHEFRERGEVNLKGVGPTNVHILVRRLVVPIHTA